MTDANYERLHAFAEDNRPPRSKGIQGKTVPPITQGTIYWGAGLVGIALIFMLVVRLIGGDSFAGDILVLGTIGVLICGIIFCLSALGAYALRRHQLKKAGTSNSGWVAALVVDRQYDASDAGTDFVFIELIDGRRVRLKPQSERAMDARKGEVGWASYRQDRLMDFVPE
ncbi:MAG: hypothetical protein CMK06_11355 [Ponticaulis sp.]|nr:hypothetical protein [Ponticaulis sp.]|tara:strand:+ start:8217 stop:8726 length:510 start_codon:yes stop_codon:yes gene_type:complete